MGANWGTQLAAVAATIAIMDDETHGDVLMKDSPRYRILEAVARKYLQAAYAVDFPHDTRGRGWLRPVVRAWRLRVRHRAAQAHILDRYDLRRALRPFAALLDSIFAFSNCGDDFPLGADQYMANRITVGDLRRAKRMLT